MAPKEEAAHDDCLCGSKVFDRVTIERAGPAYVTAFPACRVCGAMYYAPTKPGGWGAPPVVPTKPRPRQP